MGFKVRPSCLKVMLVADDAKGVERQGYLLEASVS